MNHNEIQEFYKNAILKSLTFFKERKAHINSVNNIISEALHSFKIAAECFAGKTDIISIEHVYNEDKNRSTFKVSINNVFVLFSTEVHFSDIDFNDDFFFSSYRTSNRLNRSFLSINNEAIDPENFIFNAIKSICAEPVLIRQLLIKRSELNETDRSYFSSCSDNSFYTSMLKTYKDLPAIDKINDVWNKSIVSLANEFIEHFKDRHSYINFADKINEDHYLYSKNKIYDIISVIEENPSLLVAAESEIENKIFNIISEIIKKEISYIIECIDEDNFNEFKKTNHDNMWQLLIFNSIEEYLTENQNDMLDFVSEVGQAIDEVYNIQTIINNDLTNRFISLSFKNTELFRVKIDLDNCYFETENGRRFFDYTNKKAFIHSAEEWLSTYKLNEIIFINIKDTEKTIN